MHNRKKKYSRSYCCRIRDHQWNPIYQLFSIHNRRLLSPAYSQTNTWKNAQQLHCIKFFRLSRSWKSRIFSWWRYKAKFKLDSLHIISTVDNCVKLSTNHLPKFSHALAEQDFDSILMEIVEKLILFLTRFIKKLLKLKSMQAKSLCPTCSRSVYSPLGIPPDLEAMSGLFYLYCIECIEDSGDFSIIDINDEAKLSQIIFSLSSLIRNISYDLKLSKNYTQNAPLMTYLIAILNVDLDNAKNSVTALPESLTTLLIKVNFTFQNHTLVLKNQF